MDLWSRPRRAFEGRGLLPVPDYDAGQHKVENMVDPLKWWNDNCHVYPTLYHMALDYLSIPSKFLSISLYTIVAVPMDS
jgi:hypothetical protein